MKTKIWIFLICIQVGLIGLLFKYTYAHNELILKESLTFLNKVEQQFKVEKEIILSSVGRKNFNSKQYGYDFNEALYDLRLDNLIEQAKSATSIGHLLILRENLVKRIAKLDPFYAKVELNLNIDSFNLHNTDLNVLKKDFINLVLTTKVYLFSPILFSHKDVLI